ncbi:skp1 family, dimerization domain-containing protein [Ditylenchus destructor]|uniref:Skp1 family, dimerization domain-containing protein n=1 Tax=Ditylenchus destructor TaxID=166010 RepID=A0AAD4MHX1_9BILA|nr:skp1 family, dimerization domain-containing protein [Ditylenchus destructor]
MASDGPGTSNASATENLNPPNVNDDKLIKCQPGDNESDIIEVPFKQIKQSHTFFNMFRDLGCEVDDVPDPEVKEDPATRERIWFTLNDYENKFYDVPVDIMAEAELIKNKSPEEIRDLLGLEDDLTPEEKEEIKKQNVWCNY